MNVQDDLKKYFVKGELIPAVVQEKSTSEVLMLAYMNEESLRKTMETGYTWFYSRSRQELLLLFSQTLARNVPVCRSHQKQSQEYSRLY